MRLHSDGVAIAQRFESDCKAYSTQMHNNYTAIAKRSQRLSRRLQSNFDANAQQLHGDCKAIAKTFKSVFDAIAKRLS
jgi:hypothetical protein